MHRTLKSLFWIPLLAACACPRPLPDTLGDHALTVKMEAGGSLWVEQALRPHAACEAAKAEAKYSLRGPGGLLATVAECLPAERLLRVRTRYVQKPGRYEVRFVGKKRRSLQGPVRVSARYLDADFHSTEDRAREGARPLEAGSRIEGSVDYHGGDRTDWIRLPGKKASVQLRLVTTPVEEATAEVYVLLPGETGIRRVGALSKTARTFALGADDLVVRVRAKDGGTQVRYTLTRKDSEARKKIQVQVVDCYPVGGGMGVALLRAQEGLSVNDGIVVSASNGRGQRRVLGKCTVKSVTGSDASCELPYSDHAEWTEFRVEGVFPGGSA